MATVTFTGNIGKYHGLKFGNDGKARASFSAAETPREKNQQGEWVDGATTWFNVTLFGRDAEALDAAIPDGKGKVLVSGRMKTRKFEHNGEARESLDVVAESVGLIPRSDSKSEPAASSRNTPNQGNWGGGNTQSGNNVPGGDPWAQPQSSAGAWSNGPSDPPF